MRRIIKAKLNKITSKILLVIIFSWCGLASCTYYTNEFDPCVVPDNVSFSEDIVPSFTASCATGGCHDGTIAPDLQADVAYLNLVGLGYVVPGTPAEDNSLYQVIESGSMVGFATDCDRNYIKKWLDEGAEDN